MRAQSRIVVRASLASGKPVVEFVLEHGADPVRQLLGTGWAEPVLQDARRQYDGSLALEYSVVDARTGAVPGPTTDGATGAGGSGGGSAGASVVRTDPGLVLAPGETAHPHQRTAAYAVVRSDRGVLLTELSDRTSAPGRWTLPGGGLDPGEEPVAALHREVWEESGQRVDRVQLLEVQTSHWVGRAPSGRLEDFHAVRIVYAARCPSPTDPVVHDVGGSTASVAWVPLASVPAYHLGASFAPHLGRWLALAGTA
ncbi:NUDIX hydrolase [Pedococcus sp. 5OH_020]|uniref:NUDIX hydrolase n=1 Tax=Pedococcus sp. 5OH_020 TaxID=2989814 RepID=UPI0022E9CC04|nr:NUDIX domain-containing protein [Pedococcus sp. 5OH_020]